jgi:hypothetical protein
MVGSQRYLCPMDDYAQAAHAIGMNGSYAVHAPGPGLQTITDTIAALIRVPAATRLPSTSATNPTSQTLPRELSAANDAVVVARASGPLKDASISRLACLFRHWTWANEARAQFERELAVGWEYDDDPMADHPFGAYYHWCALLCGFSEAALEHALLSELQLESLRTDLEASLPGLRACRQLLAVIPASFEEHPRIVDLLHDHETLGRLRRIHSAFGDALREEQLSRQLEWLLYEH